MRTLVAFSVLVLVAGCQIPPPEMTEAEIAQIEAEVMEFAEAWLNVWEQNDCEAGAVFLHPTQSSFLWEGKALSRAEWLEICTPFTENRESFTGHWNEVTVRVLTSDAAVFVGTYTDTIRFVSGTLRTWADNSQTGLVERTPEGWVFTTLASTSGSYEDIEGG